jgi:hypothetical protein
MLMRCEEWNFGQRGLIASNDAFAHPRYKLADFLRRFARGPLAPGFGNERNIALADFFCKYFRLPFIVGHRAFQLCNNTDSLCEDGKDVWKPVEPGGAFTAPCMA